MTSWWGKVSLGLFALSIWLAPALPVSAQDESLEFTSIQSNIELLPSGRLEINEVIAVKFITQHHGLFRDIPYLYKDQSGQEIYTEVTVEEVRRDGVKEPFSVSYVGSGYQEVKIGDPDLLITGDHQYTIEYGVVGVINQFDRYDELYWNATGNHYQALIRSASAKVTLPVAGIVQSKCYQGPVGSQQSCSQANISSKELLFTTTKPLYPGDGLTVAVGFNSGMVPILRPIQPSVTADPTFWWGLLTGFLVFMVGLILIIGYWLKYGRDQDGFNRPLPFFYKQAIAPEYDPPGGLRPALMLYLKDEKCSTKALSATIVDLAVRGYLKISALEKESVFLTQDYQLELLAKDQSDLLPYERKFIDNLFDGLKISLISKLKNKFYAFIPSTYQAIEAELMTQGLFRQNPTEVKKRYALWAIPLFLIGIITVFNAHSICPLAFSGGSLIILGILVLATSNAILAKTGQGTALLWRIRGYKLFLSSVERYKQQWMEREGLFTQVLPYAMIFGVTKQLVKDLEMIGIQPITPNWYSGYMALSALDFANSLERFGQEFVSVAATSPRGSGSGGGGFSGGGFGGGGGGGW